MVKLEDAVVARLSSHSTTFEILVDPELAMAVKSGQSDDIRGVLALDKVFKDAKKGDKAADEMVQKVFGTTDVLKVSEEILRKGEIQVTTEQRRQMREQRLRQVIALISKRAINPQTGTPHPPTRIESAMEDGAGARG